MSRVTNCAVSASGGVGFGRHRRVLARGSRVRPNCGDFRSRLEGLQHEYSLLAAGIAVASRSARQPRM